MATSCDPAQEVLPPEVMAQFPNSRGGRPRKDDPKQAVSIRLDASVLQRLRDQGPGWQTRVNDALARMIERGEP